MYSAGISKNLLILGIPISKISREELFILLSKNVKSSNSAPLFIATVNPSFIVKSKKDKEFEKILTSKTSINTPDGVGVQLAADYLDIYNKSNILVKFLGGLSLGLNKTLLGKEFNELPDKITGVELTEELLNLCQKENKRVLIVHRPDGLTSTVEVTRYLGTKYPNLSFDIKEAKPEELQKLPKSTKCDVLLCAIGEVAQEVFITRNIGTLKPKVAIGIGGTFDVLVSSGRLSPNFNYDKYGLSWLLRLLRNPNRYKKIITSVIVFPILVFLDSVRN